MKKKAFYLFFLLGFCTFFCFSQEENSLENNVNVLSSIEVGDGVSNLKIIQNYKNEQFIFFLQDNALKEIKTSGEIIKLYESEKIEYFEICDTLFGTAIAVIETNNDLYNLTCLVFDFEMEYKNSFIFESGIPNISDIVIFDFQDRFEFFALKDKSLYNYTVHNYETSETNLIAENVLSFRFANENDVLYGYIQTEKNKITLLLKDNCFHTVDLDNIVLINEFESCPTDYIAQYIVQNENGYFILGLKFNEKLQYDLFSLYDDVDYLYISILNLYNNDKEYLIFYVKDDNLYLRIKNETESYDRFITTEYDKLSVRLYTNDSLIINAGENIYLFNLKSNKLTEVINNNQNNISFYVTAFKNDQPYLLGFTENGKIKLFEINDNILQEKNITLQSHLETNIKNFGLQYLDDGLDNSEYSNRLLFFFESGFIEVDTDNIYCYTALNVDNTAYVNNCVYIALFDGKKILTYKY